MVITTTKKAQPLFVYRHATGQSDLFAARAQEWNNCKTAQNLVCSTDDARRRRATRYPSMWPRIWIVNDVRLDISSFQCNSKRLGGLADLFAIPFLTRLQFSREV